jgi:hypothetical protein
MASCHAVRQKYSARVFIKRTTGSCIKVELHVYLYIVIPLYIVTDDRRATAICLHQCHVWQTDKFRFQEGPLRFLVELKGSTSETAEADS